MKSGNDPATLPALHADGWIVSAVFGASGLASE